MIRLEPTVQFSLAIEPQDFRKGIDGFCSLIKHQFDGLPNSGTTYVFINRARTMLRFLSYDGTGYWLMTKRISSGRFKGWPKTGSSVLSKASAKEISIIIKGANPYEPTSRPTTEKQPAGKDLHSAEAALSSASRISRGNPIGTSYHRH